MIDKEKLNQRSITMLEKKKLGKDLFQEVAAPQPSVEKVRSLIDAGADVNAEAKYRETALMKAAERGHVEIAKHLLEAGADVNAKNKEGRTALKFAVEYEHVEIVELLLEAGADG